MSIQPGSGGGTSEASSLAALKSLHDTSASTLFSGVTPPGLINLGIGAPSDDCLPTGRVREAWHAAWGHPSAGEALAGSASSPDFLQYGPQLGHSAVVDALSGFLTRSYRETFRAMDGRPDFLPVEPSRLAVTAGASQSFFNLACLLLRKDAVVLMEDPTYFLAWASIGEVLGGFEAYGIRQRPGKGLDVNELERTLKGLASRPGAFKYDRESFDPAKDRFPYLLYSCATYNNPTGSTLGHEERRRIVELAYEYGVLVVCDDGGAERWND